MRAVLLTDYGDVDKLELRDVPEPKTGPGDVKVRVAGASVNPIDWKLRSGSARARMPLELPAILGRDASGEVVEVGPGVTAFRVGDRVLGLVLGAFAEYVVAKEEAWAPMAASLDVVDAAALPLVSLTGSQLVDDAVKVRAGDVVLVTGALGSVGRAAVFTAITRGAKVWAGVRGTQKVEATKLGVEGVAALDDDAEVDRLPKLDAIADTVGGPTTQKLLGKVKGGGTVGSVVGEPTGAKERGLVVRAFMAHPDRKRLSEMAQAAAEGKLVVPIATRMPLAAIREAQRLGEKGAGGKIVLRVR
jgi:NADPH:quinone reductase-like Zn-dependent oxidoreductase